MPNVPNSTITERIGVHYIGYLFSLGGVIFREISNTDVGIDAQIELIDENGVATGKLAGIQIKSGDSFVNIKTRTFTFRAEKKHFDYWKRYTLPIIGVVYSPCLNTAIWFDLKEHSNKITERKRTYRIVDVLNQSNELNNHNIANILTRIIQEFYVMPVSKEESERIAKIQDLPDQNPIEVEETKKTAWKRLTNVLFASNSDSDVLADAGFRLSWYFPTVSQAQKDFFIDRISNATNEELKNVILAIEYALSTSEEHVADHMCDLLSYIPKSVIRLKDLANQQVIPISALESLFQVIEHFTEEYEEEFRKEILDLYENTSKSTNHNNLQP